ncbi:hypothetical protein DOE78_19290 [Bacillus sp. Y1]|nr:hypothetical protein DOE78_19290 [Bacillus sp. Y1]
MNVKKKLELNKLLDNNLGKKVSLVNIYSRNRSLDRKVLDSWGISVTSETPQANAEEAHRPPPGKQAPGEEISLFSTIPNYCKKFFP